MCGVDPKFTPSATRLELQTLELLPTARRDTLLAPRPFHWYLNRNLALPPAPNQDPDIPVGQQFPFPNFNGIGSMSVKQLIVTTPSPPNNLSLSTNSFILIMQRQPFNTACKSLELLSIWQLPLHCLAKRAISS